MADEWFGGLPDLHPDAIGATVNGVHYTRDEYEALRRQREPAKPEPDFAPIEEYGCHRPHCKATGVVERKPWMRTVNERTLCDCGLAAAIAENARWLALLDDVPPGT